MSAVIAGAISLTAVSIQDHDNAVQAQATQEIQATGQLETAAQALFETANSIYDYQTKCPEGVAWLQCSEHAAGYPTYVVDAANLQAVATVVADGTAGNLATQLASAVRATIHSSTATVEFSRWPSMANAYEALIQRCAVLLSEKH